MTRIHNLTLAVAAAAAAFAASPASAAEDTELRAGVKCDWGFNNCNARGGVTYSNTQTHGSHTETNKLDLNADKDGPSLDGSHNNTREAP
ncbi:hypothetical protein HFO65_36735 [Rhizobium laguerreae]|uniref:hypothetical protein n=1 Tax=Rhizobium laguerreae TaxID=1076926 RepID=UPI001C910EDC|nr:hypothetical protein [Rhizobium laguerreae]MBY3143972.1 hypothetical protein [Rhizobium laguerreae]MBY3166083.1 hypothetical protein [Rhizobium laguerreae]MBY3266988.1 hypothetical protein [Rhizobium laguerreae]MBY3342124.1 hypothetical protein [Rhizobium laguerreae]